MVYNKDYIETLIQIILKNKDQTWLGAFLQLRNNQALPGGGAGSLNDWSPFFEDWKERAWYGILYKVLKDWYIPQKYRHPYQEISLKNNPTLQKADNITVSTCSNCGAGNIQDYTFEKIIAKYFLKQYLAQDDVVLSLLTERKYSIDTLKVKQLSKNLKLAFAEKRIQFIRPTAKCSVCRILRNQQQNHYQILKKNNSYDLVLIQENVSYVFW